MDISYWPAHPDDLTNAANYWPPELPTSVTVETFEAFFQIRGFERCETGEKEEDFEKVALFATEDGKPQHAARQLRNGTWTSKLGEEGDIEHYVAEDAECIGYGRVIAYFRRPWIATSSGRRGPWSGSVYWFSREP